MSGALLIRVRLHEGRYHGEGDWPPCPARLFQALVAAAGLNGTLASMRRSLEWLQRQPAPIIGAPRAHRVPRGVMFYMPNNDLDAVQGDPRRLAEIRSAKKVFQPYLFDANVPFLYVWPGIAEEDKHHADAVRSLADLIYQFGRGIDMAWARGDALDSREVEPQLAEYPGKIFRPSGGNGGTTLLCPQPGSLESLDRRHAANAKRFSSDGKSVTFRKAPRPSFERVSYNSPPRYLLYELRSPEDATEFAEWSLVRVSDLVTALRDIAVERLQKAFPDRKAEIDRVLIGRKPGDTNGGSTRERVRIIPLPSIGHYHADRAIRRVLIEVPAGCSFRAEDVRWAFSGLEIADQPPSKSVALVLTPAGDEGILRHYNINEDVRVHTFYTVTAAALPETAARRRIEPRRRLEEAKNGVERRKEERSSAEAVLQALRHAGVRTAVQEIRAQREPFEGNGECAGEFATGTRFSKHQLWHIRITFIEPIAGPLVIGDGRFLGLGIMAAQQQKMSVARFALNSTVLPRITDTLPVAESARRTLMGIYGRLFSQHDSSKARSAIFAGKNETSQPLSGHGHAYYLPTDEDGDGRLDHLTVVASEGFGPREVRSLDCLKELKGLGEIRSRHPLRTLLLGFGRLGEYDPGPCGCFQAWISATPFIATRYLKKRGTKRDPEELWNNHAAFLTTVIKEELRRFRDRRADLRDLPADAISVQPIIDANGVFRVGWKQLRPIEFRRFRQKAGDDGGQRASGGFRLTFPRPVKGPICLGHSSHFGMGLFVADDRNAKDQSG